MRDVLCKKGMILAVIVLFVGTSVIPGISGNINNISYSGAIEMASLDDPPEEEWNKTFGGGMYDVGYSVQQTTDRGYILAGRTDSYGAGGPDIWLIKTDSSGSKIWDKTFGGDNWDDCASVKHTTDGGYILTGFTASYGPGDVWLIKTDSSGNLLWDKTFGGSEADWGVSVQQTDDGGYIIAGVTISYGAGGWDVWLIKTNSNGAMQWNKTFGGLYDEAGWSVQQTTDGGYIITGPTLSFGAGYSDVWLIKTDNSGNKQWDKTFGGIDMDAGVSVQHTDDGYIVTGYSASYGAGDWDVWLIKTDNSGNKQWDKTFGGLNKDCGESVEITSDDGYIIAGYTSSYGAGGNDAYLIKTDSSGNMKWNKIFGGIETDGFKSVMQTIEGGYILTGWTASYGAGDYDFLLMKLASEEYENIDIDIKGGFRASAIITNTGTETITDFPWSIDLEGGLILAGEHSEGVISELASGATTTKRQSTLYGIGNTVITATAGDATKQATGFILGPLVLGVEEIS